MLSMPAQMGRLGIAFYCQHHTDPVDRRVCTRSVLMQCEYRKLDLWECYRAVSNGEIVEDGL
jgi:hypothetical protein